MYAAGCILEDEDMVQVGAQRFVEQKTTESKSSLYAKLSDRDRYRLVRFPVSIPVLSTD
jgi:hypothetical protein